MKENLANQEAMLKALQVLTQKIAAMHGLRPTSKPYDKRGPRFGTTWITCVGCGQEGPCTNVGRSNPVPTSELVREIRSMTAVGSNARMVYLDVLIDGEPVDCLLYTGSEAKLAHTEPIGDRVAAESYPFANSGSEWNGYRGSR